MAVDVGSLIREQRIRKGLTQRNVADFVGVTEATVSRWESGEIGNMRRDKIAKLSSILSISPLKIMGFEEELSEDRNYTPPEYYHDPEVARLAQELKENPGLHVLMDASRGLKKESIEEVKRFIEFQKAKELGDFD